MYNRQKVVLVVEDSPTQASFISSELGEAGVKVLCAVNGMMGLRLAQQVHPDMIVLDINMPDMNGYEVCETLKLDPETRDIPIIMLSRADQEEAQLRARQLGALEFVPKDVFAKTVLIETMRQMGFLDPDPA
jgi:two-component system, sensor histidine kinase and response regulator